MNKCKWCGESIDKPARGHTMPPCFEAPERIHKKWAREEPLRRRIDESYEAIISVVKSMT